jgi:hypothetical protein
LAVKALMVDDLDMAYSFLAAAMQLSPNNVETLNTQHSTLWPSCIKNSESLI